MTTGRINQIAFNTNVCERAAERRGDAPASRLPPRCKGDSALEQERIRSDLRCNVSPSPTSTRRRDAPRSTDKTVFRLPILCSSRERDLCETSRVSVLGMRSRCKSPRPEASRFGHVHDVEQRRPTQQGSLPGSLYRAPRPHTAERTVLRCYALLYTFCASALTLHI